MYQEISGVAVTVQWFSVLSVPERMGMDNNIPVINVGMVKKCIAPEEPQENNQEEIP
jgi:hypothetical protein